MNAETTVNEARQLANLLVEEERGHVGGNVDLAIYRVSTRYGVDDSALRSLRYRWRQLKQVPAHVLEALREAYEDMYEAQRRKLRHQIAIEKATARPGSPMEDRIRKARLLLEQGEDVE
jgi:hypothetical protein